MKKLTAIILSLVMVLSISLGVSAAEDPKAVYLAAEEKTNALTSLDAQGAGTIKIEVIDNSTGTEQTASMDMGFDFNMQVNTENEQNPQVKMLMGMSILGESMDMEIYFRDNYLYMNLMGQKMKLAVPYAELEAALAQAQTGQTDQLTSLLTQDFSDYYTNFAMTENPDGTKAFTFSIDAAKMNDLYSQIITAMGIALPQDVSISYRDMDCSAVVNTQGYLTNMAMQMGIDVDDSVTSVKVDMDITANYINPGQSVSVTFPDDLNSYPEIIGGADGPTSIFGPTSQSDYLVLGYNDDVITSAGNLN